MFADLNNIAICDMNKNAIFFARLSGEKDDVRKQNIYIKICIYTYVLTLYLYIHIANLPIEADQVS